MWRRFLLVAGLPLMLSACVPDKLNTKPEVPGLIGAAELQTLSDPVSGTAIFMRPGGEVVIELPANVTTGYFWQVKPGLNAGIVEIIRDEYVADPAPAGMVGAGGHHVYRLRALAAGKTDLSVGYARANQTPVEVRKFKISVTQ